MPAKHRLVMKVPARAAPVMLTLARWPGRRRGKWFLMKAYADRPPRLSSGSGRG